MIQVDQNTQKVADLEDWILDLGASKPLWKLVGDGTFIAQFVTFVFEACFCC